MAKLADKMKKLEGAHGIEWCKPARDQMLKPTAAKQYKESQPDYWLHTLLISNPDECMAVVRGMIGRLSDELPDDQRLADVATGENLEDHWQWYEANKRRGIGNVIVACGRALHILLRKDAGPKYDNPLHVNGFVMVWVAAMAGLTGEEQLDVWAELGRWFRKNVSQAEFTNGNT